MDLRVNHILSESLANGPGRRYTLWVQGCSIRCPGCSNKDTWDQKAGLIMPFEDIVSDINKNKSLDGVTITGGEPLDQFYAVSYLCSRLYGQISLFLTTGYTMGQIEEKGYEGIFKLADILCVGPFDPALVCSGQWRGSSNQEIIYLTDLGRKQSKMPVVSKEIHINTQGNALETGFTV